ncbi:hypothetical protein [Crossiella sp. CA198]|uniref:hypothetical protein n=1 Tax=Crossiella sp. CA198 TaxID=3455607 RepID=UPI003F8D047F
MPRRRPVTLRARLPLHPQPGRKIPQVSGVSVRTMSAIRELERDHLRPGAIAEALAGWSRFVHGTRQTLATYAPEDCPCPGCQWDDPVERRKALRLALRVLPVKAARELRALVRPLDQWYLDRSYPEPDTNHIRYLLDD